MKNRSRSSQVAYGFRTLYKRSGDGWWSLISLRLTALPSTVAPRTCGVRKKDNCMHELIN